MKRIAMAGIAHETNTFSPIKTTYERFATRSGPSSGIQLGDELMQLKGRKVNVGMAGFFAAAEKLGFEAVPLLSTSTEPSAMVEMNAFDRIMDQMLDLFRQQGQFDGVYLELHGAMVLEGVIDGETEMLRRIREVVGEIPIMASLDLHGNIARECFDLADGLVGCRTYPHVDMYETGERCAYIFEHIFAGKHYCKSYRQIPFILTLSTTSTYSDPAKTIYAEIDEVEKDKSIVSATVMEGFPPVDAPFTGPTVFAYGETQEAADKAADQLKDIFVENESGFISDLPDADTAVAQAIKLAADADKPVILSDVLDNPGGGSTSDSVWLLEALLRQDVPETALGLMFDVESAQKAFDAGEGALVELELGGKLQPGHKPFKGTFEVIKLNQDTFLGTGPIVKGLEINLGKMAHLKIDNVHIVVASARVQAADQSLFTVVGIQPAEMQILVLKSSNHFKADFQPIASTIIPVETPAAMIENPANVKYTNLREGIRLGGHGPEFKKAG